MSHLFLAILFYNLSEYERNMCNYEKNIGKNFLNILVFFEKIYYTINTRAHFQGCKRAGPVRQDATNHVRRGTEQH